MDPATAIVVVAIVSLYMALTVATPQLTFAAFTGTEDPDWAGVGIARPEGAANTFEAEVLTKMVAHGDGAGPVRVTVTVAAPPAGTGLGLTLTEATVGTPGPPGTVHVPAMTQGPGCAELAAKAYTFCAPA